MVLSVMCKPYGQRDRNHLEQKGLDMQVQDYCKAMLAEVKGWTGKLEAMKKVADSYGTEQKEKILPLIGQLEQEVANAQMRVQQLETECPSDWSPMKNELDDLFGTIGSSVDRAWRDLSPGEVGG
jgi:hypothetical protein